MPPHLETHPAITSHSPKCHSRKTPQRTLYLYTCGIPLEGVPFTLEGPQLGLFRHNRTLAGFAAGASWRQRRPGKTSGTWCSPRPSSLAPIWPCSPPASPTSGIAFGRPRHRDPKTVRFVRCGSAVSGRNRLEPAVSGVSVQLWRLRESILRPLWCVCNV